MSFIDDEKSTEGSRPREGLEFILPGETIRIATGTRNETIDGEVYTASPAQRGTVGIGTLADTNGTEVMLPITHAFVARYVAGPPQLVLVNIWRKQPTGEETVWRGHIVGVELDDSIAKFTVASRTLSLTGRRLPMVTVGRGCSHVLFDAQCKVARASHKVISVVTFANARTVRVASIGGKPDGWATHGELVHVASAERVTVYLQTGAELTLQRPIGVLRVGDSVEVYAGCDHAIDTCLNDFANVGNYGGFPHLPMHNLFRRRGGLGVYESES